jgi:hypothetical protein
LEHPNIQSLNHITENLANADALRVVIADVFNAPGDPVQPGTSAPKQHALPSGLSLQGQPGAGPQDQKSPLPGTSSRPKKEVGHRYKKAAQSVGPRPSLPKVQAVFRPFAPTSQKPATGEAPACPETSRSPLKYKKPSELANTILPPRAGRIGGPKTTAIADLDATHLVSPLLMAHYDREELYDDVWKSPIREIAKLHGISDVALAKTCRKLFIPLPGRGYWAKKAAGQPVQPRPLLPLVQTRPPKVTDKRPRSRVL